VDTIKKKGLFNRARQLINMVLDLLKERRETIDQMNRMKSMGRTKPRAAFEINMFKEELAEIVPAKFLQQFDSERMTSAKRSCKALQIRMERAYASPEKDKMKAAQLQPFISRLKELRPQEPSPECRKLLQQYRTMLAEYKISVFAQEMKTRFPVSPKRLDKKWQEIINSC
jgi:ATP-dependent helicase HrpA